jgi:hypothetical protein
LLAMKPAISPRIIHPMIDIIHPFRDVSGLTDKYTIAFEFGR